ncbi:MAG: hypothetical protein GY941_27465 [Planctomycetes bacterium]|nr:hypothetical protein [Planctomycetota bacterium]
MVLLLFAGCYYVDPYYGYYPQRSVIVVERPCEVEIELFEPPIVDTPALDNIRDGLFRGGYEY